LPADRRRDDGTAIALAAHSRNQALLADAGAAAAAVVLAAPTMRSSLALLALLALLPAASAACTWMCRGWNLGNTLEESTYNVWNPPVRAPWVFETVAQRGFDWVRIPAQWGPHTAEAAPYAVDPAFMANLTQTVEISLAQNLTVMVNTHHENRWIDNSTLFAAALPRLVAIWRQIAEKFAAYPDDQLVFELFNEPWAMSVAELNAMNAALLPVVRAKNPTRQVHFGGLGKMNRYIRIPVVNF